MEVVFQPSIFRCYVSFREGILKNDREAQQQRALGVGKITGLPFFPQGVCGAAPLSTGSGSIKCPKFAKEKPWQTNDFRWRVVLYWPLSLSLFLFIRICTHTYIYIHTHQTSHSLTGSKSVQTSSFFVVAVPWDIREQIWLNSSWCWRAGTWNKNWCRHLQTEVGIVVQGVRFKQTICIFRVFF